MTRINVVPVEELCDQFLFAEFRELTRIPNTINSGKAKLDGNYPNQYTLGTGHVKFFYPRLKWLHKRYDQLYAECRRRGINATYIWPESVPERLYRDWTPDANAFKINRERLELRMPAKPRWSNK